MLQTSTQVHSGVEYLKVEKVFDQPQNDHSKKGSLTKFYSDEATLGVTWHGCWLLVNEGLRHHCQTPDLLAPLPTANGQGTVILSVCKNHPKCAAQGKRKGWMGLSRRSMVLDAMRESDSWNDWKFSKWPGRDTPTQWLANNCSANGSRSNSYATSPPWQLQCHATCDQCCEKLVSECKKHMCPEKKKLVAWRVQIHKPMQLMSMEGIPVAA